MPAAVGSSASRTKPWPWALWIALAMAATVALNVYAALHPGGGVSAGATQLFASLCHQDAARSFALAGEPLCVCQRCFGIYAGLGLGGLAVLLGLRVRPGSHLGWGMALVPMGLHVGLLHLVPAVDVAALRFGTGLAFGLWSGAALSCALGTVRWNPPRAEASIPLQQGEERP